MARKKQEVEQKFYAKYWPQNGMVAGITNELPDSGSFIEIEKVIAEKFFSGEDSYNKYKVVNNRLEKDVPEVNLTPVVAVFEEISEQASNQDFIVEWNKASKHWSFISTVKDPAIFYIVDADNYSKLIRTIHLEDIDKKSTYSFETVAEEDIRSLAVITRKYLKSYGLRKIYD
jgi:hypothetical protein